MTRDEAVVFLLGKMDGLRFPTYSLMHHGVEEWPYDKGYIEELLRLRAQLLNSYDRQGKEEADA